jgi:cellulose synthase/poly-beta-1,6-N-acetylglucosamine synthase-like glycosyltransferase
LISSALTKASVITPASAKVSIGICAFNEEKNISLLLDNLLLKQGLRYNSEIIVVCSGCTDRTPQIVEQFSNKNSRVKLIMERERKGKASALNTILKIYKGDFLFLIPADVIPEPFSLHVLLNEMLSDQYTGVICGRPIPVNETRDLVGYMGHLIWRLHHRTLEFLNSLQLNNHASGELMVIRKGVVEQIPDSTVNDDAYIAIQTTEKNLKARYCQDAIVSIRAPTNILDFIRQRRRVVYGHHYIKRITKQSPRTLESMISYDPGKTVHVLKEELRERPKDSLKLSIAIFIEAIANLLAVIDIFTNRKHTAWAVAKSTKELSCGKKL